MNRTEVIFTIVVLILILSPLAVYFGVYWWNAPAQSPDEWQAFGSLFYGIVIVILTLTNVILIRKLGKGESARSAASNVVQSREASIEEFKRIVAKLKKVGYDSLPDNSKQIVHLIDDFRTYRYGVLGETGQAAFSAFIELYNRYRRDVENIQFYMRANGLGLNELSQEQIERYDHRVDIINNLNEASEDVVGALRKEYEQTLNDLGRV